MNIVGPKIYYCRSLSEYMHRYGDKYNNGELWDISKEDVENGAIELNPEMVYWYIDGRYYETGMISIYEKITRDDLVLIIKDIYGSVDKFLDMLDEGEFNPTFIVGCQDEELYIIDDTANRYLHWYKKTHIGRDFYTDMESKEEIIEFFKRLSKGRLE